MVLSHYHLGPRDGTLVLRLGSRYLYLLRSLNLISL